MVNDKLVHEARLEPGTQITIGSCRLVLFVGEEEERGTQDQASAEQAPKLEVAWLLDEELVEFRGVDDHTRPPSDVIGQDLRLPPGVNAMIEVISGQDVGKLFRFTKGNVAVGRRCGEVPLTDVEVSRRHSVVEVFGREMVFLRDLGSTNGTYHNGRRVSIARLQDGDTIGCGKTVMKIKLPN